MRRLLPRQRTAAQVAELRARLDQARAETARLAAELDTVTAERDEARRDCEHLRDRASQLGDRVNALTAERSRLEAALAARASAPSPTTELLRLRATNRALEARLAEVQAANDAMCRELASRAAEERVPAPGDRVIIRDRSLNCGALDGRAAILLGTRDDEDGYDYRVRITETHGLVTIGGTYETWVQGVVFPEAAKGGEGR